MTTIEQLLESVDLDFEPRWVTKDLDGEVSIWEVKPVRRDDYYGFDDDNYGEMDSFGKIKLSEFVNKHWTECIYEVPRKTTGKIEKIECFGTLSGYTFKPTDKFEPMTSKLKCTFCKEEIISDLCLMCDKIDKGYTSGRQIYKCNKCSLFGNKELWQALIQAKQDLEILKQALEKYADEDMWENCCKWDIEYIQGLFLERGYKIAKEALEHIEQKD